MRAKYTTALGAVVAVVALAGAVGGSAEAALPEFTGVGTPFTGSVGATSYIGPGGSYSWGPAKVTEGLIISTEVRKVVISGWSATPMCWLHEPVTTNYLKGRLGYINASTKQVGLLLEAEAKTSPWWKCLVQKEVIGSIIGKITPVNVKTTQFTVEFPSLGFTKFQGEEATHNLALFTEPSGPAEGFALQMNVLLTTGKAMEIKA